jgi:hypothetical protein
LQIHHQLNTHLKDLSNTVSNLLHEGEAANEQYQQCPLVCAEEEHSDVATSLDKQSAEEEPLGPGFGAICQSSGHELPDDL